MLHAIHLPIGSTTHDVDVQEAIIIDCLCGCFHRFHSASSTASRTRLHSNNRYLYTYTAHQSVVTNKHINSFLEHRWGSLNALWTHSVEISLSFLLPKAVRNAARWPIPMPHRFVLTSAKGQAVRKDRNKWERDDPQAKGCVLNEYENTWKAKWVQ